MNLSAQAAADLYEALRRGRVRCWVMGGWGVDALVGSQTREHHDLDVLVLRGDLPALAVVPREASSSSTSGRQRTYGSTSTGPAGQVLSVAVNEMGVELDDHVIELHGDAVLPSCNVAWPLDAESLKGRGVIADRPVDCVSARSQLAMHRGYGLPESHQRDVDQLLRLG